MRNDPSAEQRPGASTRTKVDRCKADGPRTPLSCSHPATARTHTPATQAGLATGGYGEAPVGALLAAWGARTARARSGVDETRPLLQGAPVDGVGAREPASIPARGDRRLGCGVPDGSGRGRLCDHRARTGSPRTAIRRTRSVRYSLAVSRAGTTTFPLYIVAPSTTVRSADRRTALRSRSRRRDAIEITERFPARKPGVRT